MVRCWWARSLRWLVEKSAKLQQGILLTSLRAFPLTFLLDPENRTEDFWWRDDESETSVRDMMYIGLRDFTFLNICGSLRHYCTEVWQDIVELSVLYFSWTLKIGLKSSGGRKMSLRLLYRAEGFNLPQCSWVSKTLQKSEKALQNCALILETIHVWLSCAS